MSAAQPVPPGWDYNPAGWSQRLPIAGVALVGFAIAAYLTAFQIDLIDGVWEPFFGAGSETVLTSEVSNILPVPDAAIGAAGYLLDAVAAVIGGPDRWRRHPWVVVLFGVAVGPLGVASVVLVVLQPVMFDSFCTLCLASALISVVMIGPAMDEVLASLQALARVRRRGDSVLHAFWHGAEG